MKKRIISLILVIVLALSMSSIGAFAASIEEKVITVDNIYQMALDNNPNVAILSNNIYIIGLTGLGTTVSQSAANASQITSLTVSKKQIAYGAQQLLLSYYKLLNTKDTLEMNVKYMAKNAQVSKVMYEVGMMSKTDYDSVLNAQIELKASLVQVNNSIEQVENTLKTMINEPLEATLNIGEFDSADISVVDTLNRESCYNEAMQNNYNVRATFSSLDSAHMDMSDNENDITETSYDSARITYKNAKTQAETAFKTQWDDLLLKRDTVILMKSKLDVATTTYETDKSRYNLGMLSPLEYMKAENDYNTAVINYENACIDFTAAYERFEALVAGIELSSTAG